MCGIFGYYAFSVPLTRRQLLDILFSGLRRLEYRGYDSAGICIESEAKQDATSDGAAQPIIFKAKGNIPALETLTEQRIASEHIDVSAVCRDHVGAHDRCTYESAPHLQHAHKLCCATPCCCTSSFPAI